ncbi:MAG TPA: ribbon-helix-helix protein, CopG family [Actinomycetota bacterium]
MPRTTVSIDASVLRALKRRARDEGKSLGQVMSELLAPALRAQKRAGEAPAVRWRSRAMEARVDLEDRDAVMEALDGR